MDKCTIPASNPDKDDISRNATDIAEMDVVPVKKAREYFFKESWQEQFPWVEYNLDKDAIFYKVCRWFKDSGKHWMTKYQRNTFLLKDLHNSSMLSKKHLGYLYMINLPSMKRANLQMPGFLVVR